MTRRCAHAGCQTILSSYNPDRECFIHALPRWGQVGKAPRRRRLEELEGKHPEDLRFVDGDREKKLAALRRELPIWDELHRRYSQRKPRDVMEA
jgi:hypothetical protein